MAYWSYGNHATVDFEPEKTCKALVKDNKKGYTLIVDKRIVPLLLNCHLTPQGVVDLNTPYKNPRPIFDSSFRPHPWCMAINDWTSKATEPPLTFATAEMEFMVWLYNLRITYPTQEVYLADDDISGAYRRMKYHPNLMGMHTSIQCGFGVINTGGTFGDNTSPSNFDPLAVARRALSQDLWLNATDLEDKFGRFLPNLVLEADVGGFVATKEGDDSFDDDDDGNQWRGGSMYPATPNTVNQTADTTIVTTTTTHKTWHSSRRRWLGVVFLGMVRDCCCCSGGSACGS